MISHLLYADGNKNSSKSSFENMRVNGGHVTNDLLRLASDKVPGTDTPKYEFTEIGTATITTPEGTFVIRKFKQEKWNSTTRSYDAATPLKATFDSPNGMISALSGLYERFIAPTLPSGAVDPNYKFTHSIDGTTMVEVFADINPSRIPVVILRSINIQSGSF